MNANYINTLNINAINNVFISVVWWEDCSSFTSLWEERRLVGAWKYAAMCDSQNGFAEKVRWGKNLNFWVGLSRGIFGCQFHFSYQVSFTIFIVNLLCRCFFPLPTNVKLTIQIMNWLQIRVVRL